MMTAVSGGSACRRQRWRFGSAWRRWQQRGSKRGDAGGGLTEKLTHVPIQSDSRTVNGVHLVIAILLRL